MTITYQSELKDGILLVTASGRDDSAQEVIDYGLAVIDLAVTSGARRILCDERGLDYALGTLDTYRVATEIAGRAPGAARVAIVCKPQDFEDGKFWENVAVNRFLDVHVDTDMARALRWLRAERDDQAPGSPRRARPEGAE